MSNVILTKEEMLELYEKFYSKSELVSLDKSKVPENLHPLIHYAEFWGISDDLIRENLVEAAPPDIADNLSAVIDEYDDILDDWLCGDEASSDKPSTEYVAFSAMRMAADYI